MNINYFKHFAEYEGNVDHMYLDGAGLVTIGVGCLIMDPTTVPLVNRETNLLATRAEAFSDYNAVKALPGDRAASYYGKVCRTYLPDAAIRRLFDARLADFIRRINDAVTPLERLPEQVQLAVVDMAFNLGVSGLAHKFPRFMNALRAGDWHGCSLECRRVGISNDRNEWTRRQFEGAAPSDETRGVV